MQFIYEVYMQFIYKVMKKLSRLGRLMLLSLILTLASAVSAAPPLEDAEAIDLNGKVYNLDTGRKQVLVMLGQECPISRRMIPRLKELAAYARENNMDFYGVFSDRWSTIEKSKKFQNEYEVDFVLLMDNQVKLAQRLKPFAKPEAFVLNEAGELVYRGRIDNRFASIGRLRNTFNQHDLYNAMVAVNEGKSPEIKETQPVGCVYGDWQ